MPWVQLKKCTISAEVKTQRERQLASPWGGVVSYSLVRAESSQNPALVSLHIPGYSPLVSHWNPLSLTLRLENPRLNPRLLSLSCTVSAFPWVHLYIYTSIYTSIHPSLQPQPLHNFNEHIWLPTPQIHRRFWKACIPYHIQSLLFSPPNLLLSLFFPSWQMVLPTHRVAQTSNLEAILHFSLYPAVHV